MLHSLLLFLGDLGGGEIMLISMLVIIVPVLLIIAVVWRLFRPAKPAVSVADELHKLQELRQEGTLTEQEFEVQKQRLLQK